MGDAVLLRLLFRHNNKNSVTLVAIEIGFVESDDTCNSNRQHCRHNVTVVDLNARYLEF